MNVTARVLETPTDQARGEGAAAVRRALEELYDRAAVRLMACALAVTGSREAAEDALQEAFGRMLRLERTPENLDAYAFRCVRNAAIDQMRRRRRTVPLDEEMIFEPGAGPRESAETEQWRGRVAEALRGLTPDERETVVQHLYAELTLREIAEMRGAAQGTVASWYHRGLEKLRQRLKER